MRPVIGIIAEYNPLHNGHVFMMNAAKAIFNDAACVVVLGANFTQRGEPALIDKWDRAKMALLCGADLVLELPFFFSCSAAPDFCAGAVDILAKTKIATHIAFGMENINYKNLENLLNILADEPMSFKTYLKKYLSEGMSYAKAVSLAVNNIMPDSEKFLSSPNNMLAASYLLRIKKREYDLKPIFIQRTGMAHGEILNLEILNFNNFVSSDAIRTALNENTKDNIKFNLASYIPDFSLKILNNAIAKGRVCDNFYNKNLWPIFQAFLMRISSRELKHYDGFSGGLENLFLKHWGVSESLDEFINKCVSARYTRSYIRRCLIRALIGVNKWDALAIRRLGVPYARVLGFNKTGRELLKNSRNKTELPLITRLATSKAKYFTKYEFIASELYEIFLKNQDLHYEARHKPIFV